MIRRIRLMPTPSLLVEDIVFGLRGLSQRDGGADADAGLDSLVKHALKTNSSSAPPPNTNRIWNRLSGRVKGPFGSMAVEGPLVSGEDVASSQGTAAPFTLSSEATPHSMAQIDAHEQQQVMLFNTAKETMTLI